MILLLIALGSFLMPPVSTLLEESGWKKLSDLDVYGLLMLVITLAIFTSTINAECYHFGGYAGWVVAFVSSLVVFVAIPTIIAIAIILCVYPLMTGRKFLHDASVTNASSNEPKPTAAPNESTVATGAHASTDSTYGGTLH